MTTRLEHANLAVRDMDRMIEFLGTAFPDFRVRGEGKYWQGDRWVHLGNDETYLALNQATLQPAEAWVPYAGKPGADHLGYEVEDVAAQHGRLAGEHFFSHDLPGVIVVRLGLLPVVDVEDPAELDLEAQGAAED